MPVVPARRHAATHPACCAHFGPAGSRRRKTRHNTGIARRQPLKARRAHLCQQRLQAVGDGDEVQNSGPGGAEAEQARLQGGQAGGRLHLQSRLPEKRGEGAWAGQWRVSRVLHGVMQARLGGLEVGCARAGMSLHQPAAHLMSSGSVTLLHRLPKASLQVAVGGRGWGWAHCHFGGSVCSRRCKTQLNLHSHLRKVSSASWLAPPARSTRRAKSASRAETRKTCEGGAT